MKGTMLIYRIGGPAPEVTDVTDPATELLARVNEHIPPGYIELVPRFNLIEYAGHWHRCVAFCDEDGKRKKLETNNRATILWDVALRRGGHPGLLQRDGTAADWLVGTVIVVFGDREFMESM